jgi:hypothetical protein
MTNSNTGPNRNFRVPCWQNCVELIEFSFHVEGNIARIVYRYWSVNENQDFIFTGKITTVPMSEKYNAPRARSTAVSLIFAARPDRGLSDVWGKFGGAETLSGNVENDNEDRYN